MRRAAPLHRLPSLSGACRRLCAPAGELTRLQRFKDHIYALHTSDPSQWTDRALSRQFGVPLGRMQALLALQRLEELEGPVDEEAEALAEEVEQLLTPENLASSANARRLAALDGALQQSMPNVSMLRMSDQQEDALVGELAVRLGVASLDEPDALERVDAAISGVLDSLTPKQRAELVAVINGDFATDGEGRADGTAAASVGEAADVGAHASQGRETSAAWSAPDTPWPEALSQHPGGLLGMLIVDASQAMANDAGVLSPVVESAEELDTGVINAGVTAENPRGIPKFLVKPDLGPQLEMYIPKRLLQKLQRVRSIDTSDSLAANLEKREANLHGDKTRRKKTGDFVFVDAGKRKQGKVINDIWIVGADGELRAPSDEEHRRATLKEKAPQLLPRIKRNW